jgi:putative salt-induced outer membrane protein
MNRLSTRTRRFFACVGAALSISAAFAAPTAFAQPSVWPPLRLPPRTVVPDDGAWRGAVGAAFSLASGNTDAATALLNASAVRATVEDRISLLGSLTYGRGRDSEGVRSTTANKWATVGEYDWNLSPVWFTSLRGIAEANQIVGLDLRALVAPSVGYKVFDGDNSALSLYGGVAYTSERYDEIKIIGGRNSTRFDRFSLYLSEESRHRFGEDITLSQRFEVYPGVTGDKALLLRFNANLGLSVTRSLQLNVGLVHSYNNRPPEGQRSADTSLFTGITLRFGPD